MPSVTEVFLLAVFVLFVNCQSNPSNIQLVQTITRHGDRVAVAPIVNAPAVWTCSENVVALNSQENVNVYIPPVSQAYRAVFIPNRQTLLGNCTLGQLSSIGHQQTLDLGEHLAQVYKNNYDFLAQNYSADTIYIRSSESPRCQQSARNILTGMFPPSTTDTQVLTIPINLIELAKDDMEVDPSICPAMYAIVAEYLLTHPEDIVKIIEPIAPHLSKIGQIFNTTHPIVATFKNYDNCNCRSFHNIPEPPGMTNLIFQAMQKSYWFGGQVLFNSTAAVGIGPFIQELVNFMDQKIAGNLDYQFQLFSGHDTTVAPILAYFGAYNGVWPPYASHLQFNLFTDNGDYFVSMYYNNASITIPQCGTPNCPYDLFKSIALANVPADPAAACELHPIRNGTVFYEKEELQFIPYKQLINEMYAEHNYRLVPDSADKTTFIQLAMTIADIFFQHK